jgi:hypothetical protein
MNDEHNEYDPAALMRWIEEKKVTITFNEVIQQWTVQAHHQVVGCMARDWSLAKALLTAKRFSEVPA